MKLLYCTECKKHYPTAIAVVYFSAITRLDQDTGKIWLDGCKETSQAIKRLPDNPVYAANPQCLVCDKTTIEIVDRKECPHDWSTVDDRRWCLLCGKQERGHIQLVA